MNPLTGPAVPGLAPDTKQLNAPAKKPYSSGGDDGPQRKSFDSVLNEQSNKAEGGAVAQTSDAPHNAEQLEGDQGRSDSNVETEDGEVSDEFDLVHDDDSSGPSPWSGPEEVSAAEHFETPRDGQPEPGASGLPASSASAPPIADPATLNAHQEAAPTLSQNAEDKMTVASAPSEGAETSTKVGPQVEAGAKAETQVPLMHSSGGTEQEKQSNADTARPFLGASGEGITGALTQPAGQAQNNPNSQFARDSLDAKTAAQTLNTSGAKIVGQVSTETMGAKAANDKVSEKAIAGSTRIANVEQHALAPDVTRSERRDTSKTDLSLSRSPQVNASQNLQMLAAQTPQMATNPGLRDLTVGFERVNWVSDAGFSSEVGALDLPATARAQQISLLQQPELPRHISSQIVHAIQQNGVDKPVDLTLNPAELGRVRISLQTVDGTVTVHVIAERPETLELMRRNIDLLAQDFQNIGFDASEFAFGQNATGTDQNSDQPTGTGTSAEAIEDTVPQAAYAPTIRTDRVDIRI